MATVSTGIIFDANLMNLKSISNSDIRAEVHELMIDGEIVEMAFQTVRDQVIFTSSRILVVNVQGITGKKISFFSYPYSKIQYYGIETAGVLDIDSEIIFTFANGHALQFDFKANVNIKKLNTLISKYTL